MRRSTIANAIAGIGMTGELAVLWSELTGSYPYKLMHVPSDTFFSGAALLASVLSVGIAVTLMREAARRDSVVAPPVLTLATPLFFALVVGPGAHLVHGAAMADPINFDHGTGAAVVQGFVQEALGWGIAGLVIGTVCAVPLLLMRARPTRPAPED